MTSDEIIFRKISDYCEILGGFAFKSKDLANQGITVIKIANITDDFTVELSSTQQYFPDEMFAKKHEKYVLENRDIIIAMTGAKVGKIGRVRNKIGELTLLNQRVAKISCSDIDADYLWAAIRSPGYNRIFSDLAIGAAQPNMSAKQIGSVEVPVFPKNKEIKIGQISNSFDSLIETEFDSREICQQIISALFRSWFIDFDPVKAKAEGELPYGMNEETAALFPDSFEDSIIGPIPSGWRISNFQQVSDFITDGAHESPPSVNEGGVPMASVKDMKENRILVDNCRLISEDDANRLDRLNCIPQRGDLLIAKDGSILKHIVVFGQPERIVLLSSIALIRLNESFSPYFAKYYLESPGIRHFFLGGYTGGSAIPRFVLKEFKKFPVIVPPQEIMDKFSSFAGSLHSLISLTATENDSLSKLRNSLLPRLMSGQLKVPTEA